MKKPSGTIKAYDNREFLHSDGARVLRIQTEYMEPDQRLQRLGVKHTVIFFGSARIQPGGRPRDWYAEAAALAERVARWTVDTHAPAERYRICTGGGPGIMQAAHEGAARVDAALNIGFNISLPFEQHLNPCVRPDHAFEFHYFFMRKFWFVNLAAAAVIFPGGFGTLDELFELLTLTQTGKSAPMPILLYGRQFWTKVVNFKLLVEQGLISVEDLDSFTIVDSVEEAYAAISGGVGQSHSEIARAQPPRKKGARRRAG
ncbi:MAG: LOG family protein [Nevskiaceae bacterium]|nr:MAG: LOG family protein [Nevskiaceae bacterium]